MSKNRAASIRARLKNRSDAAKQDFNLTLTYYGLERLLYRLSVSRHAPNFLLKGALLFKLWYDVPHRPTRDADLLGFGPDDIESVTAVFRDVCVIEVDDGIAFEAGSVKTAEIRKEAGYGGVRVELRATLDGAQLSLQVQTETREPRSRGTATGARERVKAASRDSARHSRLLCSSRTVRCRNFALGRFRPLREASHFFCFAVWTGDIGNRCAGTWVTLLSQS